MHFCDNCKNMFYIKLEGDDCDKIIYYCRNCGNVNNNLLEANKCILKEHITKNNNNINMSINKFTKFDNTLPRINYIKCPNEKCQSNSDDFDNNNREIIYIRYNNINMQYMYLCSHCDTYWNIDK